MRARGLGPDQLARDRDIAIPGLATSNIYGSPSEVCVIDELTVFKGLSGDEARPLLYSWFSTTQFT